MTGATAYKIVFNGKDYLTGGTSLRANNILAGETNIFTIVAQNSVSSSLEATINFQTLSLNSAINMNYQAINGNVATLVQAYQLIEWYAEGKYNIKGYYIAALMYIRQHYGSEFDAVMLTIRQHNENRFRAAHGGSPYVYGQGTYNGVGLHWIKTFPDNIELKWLSPGKQLKSINEYGSNGGFFGDNGMFSIAINDSVAVRGTTGNYSGEVNGPKDITENGIWDPVPINRGTLVWDRMTATFSVQKKKKKSELEVASDYYWAQGGLSMNPSHDKDSAWSNTGSILQDEYVDGVGGVNETRARVGLVYDDQGYVWIVMTQSYNCTMGNFRAAIQTMLNGTNGNGNVVNGIFLDGGGSSQMRCAEANVYFENTPGNRDNTRAVPQIVALINKV